MFFIYMNKIHPKPLKKQPADQGSEAGRINY